MIFTLHTVEEVKNGSPPVTYEFHDHCAAIEYPDYPYFLCFLDAPETSRAYKQGLLCMDYGWKLMEFEMDYDTRLRAFGLRTP